MPKANITPISERETAENLMKMGFRPHFKGYSFMIEAVKLRMGNPAGAFHRDIYEPIADKYGTTVSRVERAIRHSIEIVHEIKSPAWQELCETSWPYEEKPNNGFVIAVLAELHRLRMVS